MLTLCLVASESDDAAKAAVGHADALKVPQNSKWNRLTNWVGQKADQAESFIANSKVGRFGQQVANSVSENFNAAKTAVGDVVRAAESTGQKIGSRMVAPLNKASQAVGEVVMRQAGKLMADADNAFGVAAGLAHRAEDAAQLLARAEKAVLKAGEIGGETLEKARAAVQSLRAIVTRSSTQAAEAGVRAAEMGQQAFIGGETARNAVQLLFARANEKAVHAAATMAERFASASGSAESILRAEELLVKAKQATQAVEDAASAVKTFGGLAGESAAKTGLATAGKVVGWALMVATAAHSGVETSKTLIALNNELKQGKWDARKYEDAWLGSTLLPPTSSNAMKSLIVFDFSSRPCSRPRWHSRHRRARQHVPSDSSVLIIEGGLNCWCRVGEGFKNLQANCLASKDKRVACSKKAAEAIQQFGRNAATKVQQASKECLKSGAVSCAGKIDRAVKDAGRKAGKWLQENVPKAVEGVKTWFTDTGKIWSTAIKQAEKDQEACRTLGTKGCMAWKAQERAMKDKALAEGQKQYCSTPSLMTSIFLTICAM